MVFRLLARFYQGFTRIRGRILNDVQSGDKKVEMEVFWRHEGDRLMNGDWRSVNMLQTHVSAGALQTK